MADHEPFEKAGIPAVWIERLTDPAYHTAGDTTAHLQRRRSPRPSQSSVRRYRASTRRPSTGCIDSARLQRGVAHNRPSESPRTCAKVAASALCALVSEPNRTAQPGVDGKVEANPRLREPVQGGSRRRTLRISPLSHPVERPAAIRGRPPQVVGQVGRSVHPLSAVRWAPASLRHIRRGREHRAPSGVVRGSTGFRPGTGRLHALSAVSSFRDPSLDSRLLLCASARGGCLSHLVRRD